MKQHDKLVEKIKWIYDKEINWNCYMFWDNGYYFQVLGFNEYFNTDKFEDGIDYIIKLVKKEKLKELANETT